MTWPRRSCPCASRHPQLRSRRRSRSERNRLTSGSTSRSDRLTGTSRGAGDSKSVSSISRSSGFAPAALRSVWYCTATPAPTVVVDDLPPGVEQVDNSVLHAPQTLLALVLVRERLRAHPLEERVEQVTTRAPRRTSPIFSTPRGGSSVGSDMAREADERAGKATIERARRERRDARDLDGAVEGLVVVANRS